ESKNRFIAGMIPQIVWTFRPDGRFEYFNDHWEEFTGKSLEDIRREGVAGILHPDDVPEILARWQEACQRGTEFIGEFRLKSRDAETYRWFLCRTAPRRDATGRIVEWIGTGTDITAQKETAAMLEQSRNIAEAAWRAKSD